MAQMMRWAPVAGILAPILWFVGGVVSESDAPDDGANAEEILGYFQGESSAILLGGVLFLFGTLFFVLFLAHLRSRVRGIASDDATSLMWAMGLLGIVGISLTWGPQLGIAIAIEDMDAPIQAATAEAAWHAGTGFFVVGELLLALFLFAAAAVNRRAGLLPSWLAWFGVAVGVVALVPPIGWLAIIFGLPLWTLVAAIILTLEQRTSSAPPTAT